jgi:hypothetical protein
MLSILLALSVQGQKSAPVFHDLRKLGTALQSPPKLSLGLDSRRSFISNRDVKMLGLRVSMDFQNRARLGFGLYFLASPYYRLFNEIDAQGLPTTARHKLQFTYISAYFEYVILSSLRWEFSMPVHLGIGDVGFVGLVEEPKSVLLTEATLLGSYKIFPFLGLGGGVGYRQILAGGTLIRENFNSPTYSFGLKFWFGYLYQKYIKKQAPVQQP